MRPPTPDEVEEEIEVADPPNRSSIQAESQRGSTSRSSRQASEQPSRSIIASGKTPSLKSGDPPTSGGNREKSGRDNHRVTEVGSDAEVEEEEEEEDIEHHSDGDINGRSSRYSVGSSVIELPRSQGRRSGTAHGPRGKSTDPIILDDLFSATSSPSSASGPRARKYIGAPYVDIPLLPLHRIKQYSKPANRRLPTALSRNEVLQFEQTPPRSSPEDPDDQLYQILSDMPVRTGRQAAKRNYPTWKTTSVSESSADLGGYGSISSSSDEVTESEESDMPVRRNTRAGQKMLRNQPERSTRRGGRLNQIFQYPDGLDSSRSSLSHEVHSMPTHKHKTHHRPTSQITGKRKRNSGSGSSEADEDQSWEDGSEEDELDLLSAYSDSPPARSKGKGKAKAEEPELTDDVLYKHRNFCEKCGLIPADDLLEKAQARKKKPGRKRKRDPDELSDEELAEDLGGWLECQRCVVAMHWGCLGERQKKEVLSRLQEEAGPVEFDRPKIKSVEIDEQATFLCARCDSPNSKCFVCHSDELPHDKPTDESSERTMDVDRAVDERDEVTGSNGEAQGTNGTSKVEGMPQDQNTGEDDQEEESEAKPLRFRCVRCKQEVHYEHLDDPFAADDDATLAEIADYYQHPTGNGPDGWQCHQCRTWVWTVDMVIAWRPMPADAKEEFIADETPNYKDPLPREYLVKWNDRGFRHTTWVPHAWLLASAPAKLKNFFIKGPSLDLVTDDTLAARGDDMEAPTIANVMGQADSAGRSSHHRSGDHGDGWKGGGPPPDVDAENSIPVAWKTVDRVLDVMLLPPPRKASSKGKKRESRGDSVFEVDRDALAVYPDGIEPAMEDQMEIDDWQEATGRDLGPEDVDQVAKLVTWCYVKWDDLQYEQSTWDTPPPKDSPLYPAFHRALARYLAAINVEVPVLSRSEREKRESKAARFSKPPDKQPDCIVGGTLMAFQINGFQWLLTKHFKRESCILADDMGLGKTIQIASLLGYLGSSAHNIYPFLVIVPNSTITNWVREFEKWVPHMRVVPYYGQRASRKVVSKYELYHKGMQGKPAGLKAHVVLTTYDTITSSDFSVFKTIPRWEMMIVDEGQRLKSDSNLIFNRLKALNSVHRILLTGTPLNNNLRELFNLLNFLDPVTFQYLEDLEEKYKDLNEGLLAELHAMIQPYILRRIKADVLRLPPKVEIIVPISLTPIQKHLYRSVLEKNAELIQAILAQRKKKAKVAIAGGGPKESKSAVVRTTNGHVNGTASGDKEPEGGTSVVAETTQAPNTSDVPVA